MTENVWCSIEAVLRRSRHVRERVRAGRTHIVGAVYDIAGGEVDWLGPHPDAARFLTAADDPS